jgi:hypothetical protein
MSASVRRSAGMDLGSMTFAGLAGLAVVLALEMVRSPLKV